MSQIRLPLFFILLTLWVAACTSETKTEDTQEAEEQQQVVKANWNNKKHLVSLITKHIVANSFDLNRMHCPVQDMVLNKVWYFEVKGMPVDSIRQISDTRGVVMVKGVTAEGDSLWIDYELQWQAPSPADTATNRFSLESASIMRVNKQMRYTWKKSGRFWEKEIATTL